MMAAITGDGGPLASGAMPKMGRVAEGGEKALIEALEDGPATKKKARTTPTTEKPAEQVIPKTLQEEVIAQKTEVLKCATEARKSALALKHLHYSGELVNGLMTFSKKMESVYEAITTLTNNGVTDKSRFKNISKIVKEQMEWYKQAEASSANLFSKHELIPLSTFE